MSTPRNGHGPLIGAGMAATAASSPTAVTKIECGLGANPLKQPAVPPRDAGREEIAEGLTVEDVMKDVWDMRAKQYRQWAPTSDSLLDIKLERGPQAKETESHKVYKTRHIKHSRKYFSPREAFLEPVSTAHEIGWHVDGTVQGRQTPRQSFPRTTCPMTRHAENMYSTNAQNIIRRW